MFFPRNYDWMLWMKWFRLFSAQSPSISVFKKNILKFIRLGPNNIFNIYYPHVLKLLTRLHLDFCHLRGQKFTHNFSDRLDEICMCGNDTESTKYFLLQCSLFPKERQVLMNKICDIDSSPIDQNENSLCYTLLFCKENMNNSKNAHILNANSRTGVLLWIMWNF